MTTTLAVRTLDDLDRIISQHFQPGERVELYVGLPRDVSDQELAKMQASMETNGAMLLSPIELGSTPEWENALKVEIAAPDYQGVGFIPILAWLVLAAGAVGVTAFLGAKVGNVVNAIAKYILPISLIGGGIFLAYTFIKTKAQYGG